MFHQVTADFGHGDLFQLESLGSDVFTDGTVRNQYPHLGPFLGFTNIEGTSAGPTLSENLEAGLGRGLVGVSRMGGGGRGGTNIPSLPEHIVLPVRPAGFFRGRG